MKYRKQNLIILAGKQVQKRSVDCHNLRKSKSEKNMCEIYQNRI